MGAVRKDPVARQLFCPNGPYAVTTACHDWLEAASKPSLESGQSPAALKLLLVTRASSVRLVSIAEGGRES
jgi:hypothetical protein